MGVQFLWGLLEGTTGKADRYHYRYWDIALGWLLLILVWSRTMKLIMKQYIKEIVMYSEKLEEFFYSD